MDKTEPTPTRSINMISLLLTHEEAAWILMRLPIPNGDDSTFAGMLSHQISQEIADKIRDAIEKSETDTPVAAVSGSAGEWHSC
jgi:hypothetical protein